MIIYLNKEKKKWKNCNTGTYVLTRNNVDYYVGEEIDYLTMTRHNVFVIGVFDNEGNSPPHMVRLSFNPVTSELTDDHGNNPNDPRWGNHLSNFQEAARKLRNL